MLHHVQLACPAGSEAVLREFYARTLGLTEVPKPRTLAARGGCWFRGYGVELHLGVDPDFRPARKAHPCLRVTDLDAWAARLATAGHDTRVDHELPGYRRFYVHDSVGNRLELCEPEAQSWPLTDGVRVRRATLADVPGIVELLRDDDLGATRESEDEEAYRSAFGLIDRDPDQLLVVAEEDQHLVATVQLTFTAGLSRGGMTRMTLEAVRVRSTRRGGGIGEQLIRWCVNQARERGAGLVQLTTDTSRSAAHRFYQRLGFEPSHVGMKLVL